MPARTVPARWPALALAAVVLLAAVLAIGAAARALPVNDWAVRLGALGPAGALALVAGGALATAVGMPRQLVASLAGFAFGSVAGFALALAAATAGCALTVLGSRRWLAARVARRFPVALERTAALVADDLFAKVVALRLQPLGTNLATNLAAGALGVATGPFLLASCVGYAPQTLVFALVGGGIASGSRLEALAGAGLFVVSLGLGAVLVGRHRRRARVARRTGAPTAD